MGGRHQHLDQRAEIVGVLAPGFELLFPPGTGMDAVPDMFAAMRIDYASGQLSDIAVTEFGTVLFGDSLQSALITADVIRVSIEESHVARASYEAPLW